MKLNFIRTSSILRKFLVFNLIVFLVLGIFTFLYLNAIKPNLVKDRSNTHSLIINNTLDHIKRLNVEFTKKIIKLKIKNFFKIELELKKFISIN